MVNCHKMIKPRMMFSSGALRYWPHLIIFREMTENSKELALSVFNKNNKAILPFLFYFDMMPTCVEFRNSMILRTCSPSGTWSRICKAASKTLTLPLKTRR